jgi:uncharacterized membrane protein YsdA (DUF1294 family)
MLAIAVLSFVATSVIFQHLPFAVFGLYSIASIITFIVYALDKSAAKNDQWRTPESTLHFLALTGGWPGALVAQRLVRHKSRKQSFQIVFWIIVVLNCGALSWLFSFSGAEEFRVLFEKPVSF